MKEERFFYVPSTEENEELPLAEATHALKVLRLQEGDEMFLMDGAGTFYRAQVSMTTNHRCFYNIIEKQPQEKTWHGKIHVAVAPTKNADRVEWFVEKATEVGFDEVSLLHTKFTERKIMKATRLAAIITSSPSSRQIMSAPLESSTKSGRFRMTSTQTFVSIITLLIAGHPQCIELFVR